MDQTFIIIKSEKKIAHLSFILANMKARLIALID